MCLLLFSAKTSHNSVLAAAILRVHTMRRFMPVERPLAKGRMDIFHYVFTTLLLIKKQGEAGTSSTQVLTGRKTSVALQFGLVILQHPLPSGHPTTVQIAGVKEYFLASPRVLITCSPVGGVTRCVF